MSLLQRESTESVADTGESTHPVETAERAVEAASKASAPSTDSDTFRLARLLYGGVLAVMATDNFRNNEQMVGYAESKGAPVPEVAVPAVSGSLLFGGLGIAAWKLPRLAAGAIATFFVSITPVMHDFWALDDEEEKQRQQVHFMKNAALLGAALAFLRIGEDD